MAKSVGDVVVFVVFVAVVIALVITGVVLLIGAVVVLILMASWCLFSLAIVIIPAMQVATNTANQKMILQVFLWP